MKNIQNKYLVAELWETQMILYWILAALVSNQIIKWILIVYGFIVLFTAMYLKFLSKKEEKQNEKNT